MPVPRSTGPRLTEVPTFYINQILNVMFGYLSVEQPEVEVYLAEKKYLPDVKIN